MKNTDRLLNSTLYVESEHGVDIPFEKLSVNAENGEVEVVNHLFSIDTETDVANFSSDPLGYSLFIDWIDIDWGAKLFVGNYCGEDTIYVKDPNFGQKWWQVTREPKEKYTSVCENYNVARNATDGKSYAAFYGIHDVELVEIDLDGPSFRTLKSIGGVTQYAEGSSGSAFDLVHHISIDSLNRVLYISSTEVIPIKIAGDEEAMAILRDKLWSYSLSSGSASVISESIYRLPTTFSSQRIYEVMIGKALGF